jgi:uncharacterized NAD(P)/FAD-binding protein YdhS
MTDTKHIVIIGGGLCGTVTAVNLIRGAKGPLKITIVNSGAPFTLGVAYNTYSSTHLLNVAAGNMSLFPDDMAHFTNWIHTIEDYSEFEQDLLSKTFLPRNLFGKYIQSIWETTLASRASDLEVSILEDYVSDLDFNAGKTVKIILNNGSPLVADYAVLATGNSLPRNPHIANMAYYDSPTYFKNPWTIESVRNLKPDQSVLIIGNGLTMVDTVIGLIEHGFNNTIYSLSTNGFGVLAHRHFGVSYTGLVKELENRFELQRLVGIVNKHIKKVRKLGISAGPVIDSLRPYSHKIWQAFTLEEKKQFISKFRHMWGVARHRLPVYIYDIIEKLRIDGQLKVYQGKLVDITENGNIVSVTFYNAKNKNNETLTVQRVINCTGPETSIYKTLNPLLRKLAEKGIISADPLELGINTDISTYRVINGKGEKFPNLFTLGTNLKGQLWETIAVPELRVQCKELSAILLKACEQEK